MLRNVLIISVTIIVFTVSGLAETVELPATGDIHVVEGDPDTNFDPSDTTGWGVDASNQDFWGLIIFGGLSGYTGATINQAILSVYFATGLHPYYGNYLRRITEDWDEGTATWNNRPANTTQGELEFAPHTTLFHLDVTAFVQDWVDETYDNYGFCFLRIDEYNHLWAFYSKDYVWPDYHPKLTLDYTPSPVESSSLGTIKAVFK